MSRLGYVGEALEELRSQGRYLPLPVLRGPQGARAVVQGRPVINLASNNYLGLAHHPRLVQAMVEATQRLGVGSGAVRTIVGTMEIHLELERALAQLKGTQAALTFQSGFATNLGTLPVLAGEGDGIFSDELNHASIIDGCRLSRAETVRYAHRDVGDLEEKLRAHRHRFRHAVVVTDGVFSMDGDVAPLPDLVQVAHRYDAVVYVDDAHGSGVMGPGGRGTVAHFALEAEVDVQVATLSKALGVVGGYVATEQHVVDYLTQRARPFLFSTSQPPGVAAACLEAVRVLQEEPQRVARLWERTRTFQEGLRRLGLDTGASQTPITPVLTYDEGKAVALSARLLERGVFAQAIVYPTVPRGKARVRTIVTAEHTPQDLEEALNAFAQAAKEVGLG
jgi:glycine C-acetyltransferase